MPMTRATATDAMMAISVVIKCALGVGSDSGSGSIGPAGDVRNYLRRLWTLKFRFGRSKKMRKSCSCR